MKLIVNNPDIPFTNFDYHGDKENPHGVMIIKCGYRLTENKEWQFDPKSSQLFEMEAYFGDIASSSLFRESEYVPFKPFTDILIHAHAHAPNGEAASHFNCSIEYKNKTIWQAEIYGERYWENKGIFSDKWMLTPPEKIISLPLQYEYAFGGTCFWQEDEEEKSESYAYNPAGLGFMNKPALKQQQQPFKAAQITTMGQSNAKSPLDILETIGCAPIAKSWQPRLSLTGTFDQNWQDNIWPHMPDDFDDRFWNAAPLALQLPLNIDKGEPFILNNMSSFGQVQLSVNKKNYTAIIKVKGKDKPLTQNFNLDTIYLDMKDSQNITLEYIWRLKTVPSEYIDDFEIKEKISG